MRTRIFRTSALAVGLSLAVTFVPASAGADARRAPLTDPYCQSFADFYTITLVIEFSVRLFEAFSQLPDSTEEVAGASGVPGDDDGDGIPDAEQLRATYYALLSPKLESLASRLEATGPKPLESWFRRHQETYTRGVELLRDAGLSEAQLDAIAESPIEADTSEVSQITGDLDLDDDALETLTTEYLVELDALSSSELTAKQERQLERSANECGVQVSRAYDCEDVLPESEAAAILDAEVTLEDGGCDYTGPEPVDGLTPEIAVVVYDSARALDFQTRDVLDLVDVPGIGEEAVSYDGYNADGHSITCGRTLTVADGDLTVVVALCLGGDDPEVSDGRLVEIADGVLERIA
jgi:hypothetical protein